MPASANGTGLNRSVHALEAGAREQVSPGPPRLAAARYSGVIAPPINNAGEERGEVRRTASTTPNAGAPARTKQPIEARLATPKVGRRPSRAHQAAGFDQYARASPGGASPRWRPGGPPSGSYGFLARSTSSSLVPCLICAGACGQL